MSLWWGCCAAVFGRTDNSEGSSAVRICLFEFTNARALLKAEPSLPTCGAFSPLDQARSETIGVSGRQQSCWGDTVLWGQGTQVQVTPPLVLLESAGQSALAGLQPGAGGEEEEPSAGVCVLSHALTAHHSMYQLIDTGALKARHL